VKEHIMVRTKMLLEDEEISLLEDILDDYYLSNPQDYSSEEKANLQDNLQGEEVRLSNEEIFTIWKALAKSTAYLDNDNFGGLRGKFEQLNMMLSY
jgi:hypothetical protein